MKLTAAIIGAYMGCKVKIGHVIYNITEVGVDKLYLKTDTGGYAIVPHERCQLLLTPLSKISDEDAVEVGKAFGLKKMDGHYYEWIGKAIITHHFTMYSPWDDSIFDTASNRGLVTNIHSRNYLKLVDYLRSKGYDCGHGSIPNLIAAGVAVEKKEI